MGIIVIFMLYCIAFSSLIMGVLVVPGYLILAIKEGKRRYVKRATIMLLINLIIGLVLIKAGPYNPTNLDLYSLLINSLEGITIGLYMLFINPLLGLPSSKLE